ncbi:MAG: hypothetical protein ABR511_14075 [Acidimicrobiales bacterium]
MFGRRSSRLTARGRAAAGIVLGLLFLSAPAIVLAASSGTGYLEVCKAAAGPGVTGAFDFQVGGHTVSVPVGACSAPIQLPAGTATVTEAGASGMVVTAIGTVPAARLVSRDLAGRAATVAIAQGDVSTQTVVTFTNAYEIGQLKVCKVAGAGVAQGTNFSFMVGDHAVTVPAGPDPGGFCGLAGSFPAGTTVTVTELATAATHVSSISVVPPDRVASAADLAAGRVAVAMGPGATEVSFTNQGGSGSTTTTTSTTIPGGGVSPSSTALTATSTTSTTIPGGGVSPSSTALTATSTTTPGGGVSPSSTVRTAASTTTTTVPGGGVSPSSTAGPTTSRPAAVTSSTAPGAATTPTSGGSPSGPASGGIGTASTGSGQGAQLSRTGVSTERWALWGLALLVAGVALVRFGGADPGGPRLAGAGRWRPAARRLLSAAGTAPQPVLRGPDDLDMVLADPPFLADRRSPSGSVSPAVGPFDWDRAGPAARPAAVVSPWPDGSRRGRRQPGPE